MTSIISFVLSLIIVGILYKNMIAWEGDYRISRGQALLPVILGLLSVPLSFVFFLIIGLAFKAVTGFVPTDGPLLLASFNHAFFSAALNEELAKLIITLIVLCIYRKKIRNVYEYMLVAGAVGFGFILIEDFVYSSSLPVLLMRLPGITVHMMLGLAMGRHLGLARYNKITGRGSVVKEYLLAYFVPVFWHTVFDFFEANMLIHAGDNVETMTEEIQRTVYIGAGMVVIIVVPIFFFQFYIFRRLKKNAANLVALSSMAANSTDQENTNA
ncbi:PrsW family glutamic-type intramembrane protease [Butyrivibrio sp. AE3006]|uniref:PrsW family glutamic-type intramembrane protease n=1 Tax=Butyrivibrio sp. AE3006 TaxID=1280673 RepID=UPI0003F6CA4A|nr:PrsW family glutamic-type intramembrane protease [Butyrivibrio sp. AE3006]